MLVHGGPFAHMETHGSCDFVRPMELHGGPWGPWLPRCLGFIFVITLENILKFKMHEAKDIKSFVKISPIQVVKSLMNFSSKICWIRWALVSAHGLYGPKRLRWHGFVRVLNFGLI